MESLRKIVASCCKPQDEDKSIFYLVMLGPGEAGKSTVTKQMKILNQSGFQESDLNEARGHIRRNIQDSILSILGAMKTLNIPFELPDNEEHATFILTTQSEDDGGTELPMEFYDRLEILWLDGGVKKCFERSSEYQLIDCAKYFLDKVAVVKQPDYLPSDQDILRSRVLSVGVKEMDFYVKDEGQRSIHFRLYDLGGQRSERIKWMQVFNRAMAAIFVIDISCFDLMLREDQTKNRLLEAMEVLEQAWSNRYLQNVDFIIFLNKIDLLEEKIKQGKSLQTMIDSLDASHKYHQPLNCFKTTNPPCDTEIEQFVRSFPPQDEPNLNSNTASASVLRRQALKTRAWLTCACWDSDDEDESWRDHPHISDETIRTAVFIKRFVLHVIQGLRARKKQNSSTEEMDDRLCIPFYTCAVDTQTVKKVFDSCKSFLVLKWFKKNMGS